LTSTLNCVILTIMKNYPPLIIMIALVAAISTGCTSVSSDRLTAFGTDAEKLSYSADRNAGTVEFGVVGLDNSKSFGEGASVAKFGIGAIATVKVVGSVVGGLVDKAAITAGTDQAGIAAGAATEQATISAATEQARLDTLIVE